MVTLACDASLIERPANRVAIHTAQGHGVLWPWGHQIRRASSTPPTADSPPLRSERMPRKTPRKSATVATPTLLAGGNPQIAKGDGDAPVQAYIAALPGWKHDVARRLDALIVRTVPGVRKAVKWNSPFYGIDGDGWFMSVRAFTNYLKVAFFRGTSLRPVPPGESKSQSTRYLDIREHDGFDEAQLAAWFEQASKLPGETL